MSCHAQIIFHKEEDVINKLQADDTTMNYIKEERRGQIGTSSFPNILVQTSTTILNNKGKNGSPYLSPSPAVRNELLVPLILTQEEPPTKYF